MTIISIPITEVGQVDSHTVAGNFTDNESDMQSIGKSDFIDWLDLQTDINVIGPGIIGRVDVGQGDVSLLTMTEARGLLGLGSMATEDASDYLPITGSTVSNPVALDSVGNFDKLLTFGNASHYLRKDGAVIGSTFGRENGGANGNFAISAAGYKLGGTQYVGFVPIGANALSSNPDVTIRRSYAGTLGVYQADGTTLGTMQAETFDNPSGVTAIGNAAGGMLSSGDIQMANSKDLLSNNSTLSGYWYLGNSTTASVSDTTIPANNYRTRRGLLVASESAYGFCSTNNAFGATDTYLRRAGAGSVGVYEADGTTLGTVQAGKLNIGGVTNAGCDFTVVNGRLGLTRPTNSAISLGIDLAPASSVGVRINGSSVSSGGTQFGSFLGRSHRQHWTANLPSDPGDVSIGRVASGIVDVKREDNTLGTIQAATFTATGTDQTTIGNATGGVDLLGPQTTTMNSQTISRASDGVFSFSCQDATYPDKGVEIVRMTGSQIPFTSSTVGTGLKIQHYATSGSLGLYVSNAGVPTIESNLGAKLIFRGTALEFTRAQVSIPGGPSSPALSFASPDGEEKGFYIQGSDFVASSHRAAHIRMNATRTLFSQPSEFSETVTASNGITAKQLNIQDATAGQTHGIQLGNGVLSGSNYPYLRYDTQWGEVGLRSWGGRTSLQGSGANILAVNNVSINQGDYLGFSAGNSFSLNPDTRLQRVSAGVVGAFQADGSTLGAVQASTFSNPSGVTTLGSPSGVLLSGRFLDWASFGSGYNVRMGGGTELQVGGTTDITWASTSDARSTKDLRLARDSSGVMGVWADTAKTVRGDIAAGAVNATDGITAKNFSISGSSSPVATGMANYFGAVGLYSGTNRTLTVFDTGTVNSGTSTATQFIPTSRPQVSASSGTLLQDLLTALDLTGIVEKVE